MNERYLNLQSQWYDTISLLTYRCVEKFVFVTTRHPPFPPAGCELMRTRFIPRTSPQQSWYVSRTNRKKSPGSVLFISSRLYSYFDETRHVQCHVCYIWRHKFSFLLTLPHAVQSGLLRLTWSRATSAQLSVREYRKRQSGCLQARYSDRVRHLSFRSALTGWRANGRLIITWQLHGAVCARWQVWSCFCQVTSRDGVVKDWQFVLEAPV